MISDGPTLRISLGRDGELAYMRQLPYTNKLLCIDLIFREYPFLSWQINNNNYSSCLPWNCYTMHTKSNVWYEKLYLCCTTVSSDWQNTFIRCTIWEAQILQVVYLVFRPEPEIEAFINFHGYTSA